jgi:hypothetical protein
MGSPYLSADESIILSAHDLVINTISAEVILTNQRLMLVDRTHPRLLPQDVPFAAIETVTIGENSGGEPVLSLSIVTPDGTRQPLGMTFPLAGRGARTGERDEWAARLRELSVTSQHESGIGATELLPPWVQGPIPEETGAGEAGDVVPAGTRFKGPSLSERRSRAAGASTMRTVGIAAAILLAVALIGVAALLYAPSFLTQPSPQPAPPATPEPAPAPTPVMTMPAPTVSASPEPTTAGNPGQPTQVSSSIPQTGVWVRIQYAGSFTGTAGAPGRFRDVRGTGDQFFQIPAKDELVSASVTKGDNSGNPLTVSFYRDGEQVRTATITRPGGTLNLDVLLRPVPAPQAPATVTP